MDGKIKDLTVYVVEENLYRQAVSKWETNQTEPDTSNLIELARIFGVSVEYLANGEEAPPKVVYVEKNLPIFKIIGIALIALGGLSLILGAIMPFMLGIIVSIRIERKNCIVFFSYSWVSNIFFKMDLTFCAGYATIATNER